MLTKQIVSGSLAYIPKKQNENTQKPLNKHEELSKNYVT